MSLKNVTKRSGMTVPYDRSKIYNAIAGAAKEIADSMSPGDIQLITELVEKKMAMQHSQALDVVNANNQNRLSQ